MRSKPTQTPTDPVDFVERYRRELLTRRDEIITRWREQGDNLDDIFSLSKLDSEAACLVEQRIDWEDYKANFLAREIIGSGLTPECSTYWRTVGAALRWIKRSRQTYEIHKFLGPLLIQREHLLPSEREDLFELAVRHLPVNIWGDSGMEISLDILLANKITEAIPAFKQYLLRDKNDQPITMHQALLLGRNRKKLIVLLQLMAIAADDRRQERTKIEQTA